MSKERGDFEWKGEEVIWVPSKKGKWIIHPTLGAMPFNSPLAGAVISPELAREVDIATREKFKDLKLNITTVKDFEK